jgi:cytochrome b
MKTLIWPLPTRLFHWMLVIGFAAAYLLADYDEYRNWHMAFGAFTGALLFFRILFGLFGHRYARFRDFPAGLRHQVEYLKGFRKSPTYFPGHNPAASLIMLGIMVIGFLAAKSGFMLYNAEQGTPIGIGFNAELLEEVHEAVATIFLVLIVLHLVGLVVDLIFHGKYKTLASMFTGHKNLEAPPADLSAFQKGYYVAWFAIPLVIFFLMLQLPVNDKSEGDDHREQYEQHKDGHAN